ncbi:MAG: YdcF family protein [Lachnospiraceae bacterium]|nr:YdcF family protein [Lachnospiraceae bacterium]
MEKFYQGITDFIFVEHPLQKADLIFVPGGDYPDSAKHAAALYHQGFAPFILPSGRYSILKDRFEGAYETEWEYLKDILVKEGVPETAVLKEDQATFTYENAVKSREVLERLGLVPGRAILSCQAFHARRCLMYYQEQFPDTKLLVSPVVTRDICRENWYLDREKIDVVLGEVERCGTQFHQILYEKIKEKTGGPPERNGGR